MITRQTLTAEHRELDAMAGEMLELVSLAAPDWDRLARLRWRFNRLLLAHLAKEDRLLYPRLCQRGGDIGGLASRFRDEVGGLASDYLAYSAKWPPRAIESDWPAFGQHTRGIIAALRRRILREENELYPLIEAGPPAVPARAIAQPPASASIAPCRM